MDRAHRQSRGRAHPLLHRPGANIGVAIGLPASLRRRAGRSSTTSSYSIPGSTARASAPPSAEAPRRAPATRLLAALVAGQAYVNIHTAIFPGGEIRGNLVRALHGLADSRGRHGSRAPASRPRVARTAASETVPKRASRWRSAWGSNPAGRPPDVPREATLECRSGCGSEAWSVRRSWWSATARRTSSICSRRQLLLRATHPRRIQGQMERSKGIFGIACARRPTLARWKCM